MSESGERLWGWRGSAALQSRVRGAETSRTPVRTGAVHIVPSTNHRGAARQRPGAPGRAPQTAAGRPQAMEGRLGWGRPKAAGTRPRRQPGRRRARGAEYTPRRPPPPQPPTPQPQPPPSHPVMSGVCELGDKHQQPTSTMELASVTVKIKIGKSVQEAHVDDRLDPVQIARIVGRRPEGLQIIHKGRRLAAGDVVPAGATLMVLGGGGDSGDTELSLGSDSGSSAQGGASLADFEATNRWVLAINANEEWLPLNRRPVARPLRRLLPMSVYRFVEALLGLVVATVRAVLPLGWLDPRPASAAATAPGQRHIAAPVGSR